MTAATDSGVGAVDGDVDAFLSSLSLEGEGEGVMRSLLRSLLLAEAGEGVEAVVWGLILGEWLVVCI